jgi:hypothetical protein
MSASALPEGGPITRQQALALNRHRGRPATSLLPRDRIRRPKIQGGSAVAARYPMLESESGIKEGAAVTDQNWPDHAAGVTKLGEPTRRGKPARFRCARCGDLAGVIKVIHAGSPVDVGPPLGKQVQERDGLVLDYFLGTTWLAAPGDKLDAVEAIIEQGSLTRPPSVNSTGRSGS